MRNARIYIDQNIVGYVHEGRIHLERVNGVDWIYSNEHFNEIARSGDTSFLSALERLKAQQIELVLDDNYRITDSARIHQYSPPYELYQRHLKARSSPPKDEHLFTDLLGRLFGADNYHDAATLPARFRSQVEALLAEAGVLEETVLASVKEVSVNLEELIGNDLSQTRSLETMRKSLGIHGGRVGKPKTDNPILEIWELIGKKYGGITPDQFFGFDPIDKQGYEVWPLYLGIVGCHTALNFAGYGTDKGIADPKNLPNIMSDAAHIAIASFCDAVMSEDKRFCKKASAIYKYKNHHTQVIRMELQNG